MTDIVRFKAGQTVSARTIDDTFGKVQVNFVNAVYQVSTKKKDPSRIDAKTRKQMSRQLREELEAEDRKRAKKGDSKTVAVLFQKLTDSLSGGQKTFAQDGVDIQVSYTSVADDVKLAGRHDAAADMIFHAEEPSALFKMRETKRKHSVLAWVDTNKGQKSMGNASVIRSKARSMLVLGKASRFGFMVHAFDNGNIRVSLGIPEELYVMQISSLKTEVGKALNAVVAWMLGKKSEEVAPKVKVVAVSTLGQLQHPYSLGDVGSRQDEDAWKRRSLLEGQLTQKLQYTKFGMARVGSLKTTPTPHAQGQGELERIRAKLLKSTRYDDPVLPYDIDRLALNAINKPTVPRPMVAEFDRRQKRHAKLMQMISEADAYKGLLERKQESKSNITYKHLAKTQDKLEPIESTLLRSMDRWKIDLALYRLPVQFFDIASYEFIAEGGVRMKGVSFRPDAPKDLVREVEMTVFAETSVPEERPPANNMNALFAMANRARQQIAPKPRLVFDEVVATVNHRNKSLTLVFKKDERSYSQSFSGNDDISLKKLLDMEISVPFWWTTGKMMVTAGGKDPWGDVSKTWEVLALIFTRTGPNNAKPLIDLSKRAQWEKPKPEKMRAGRKEGTTCKPPHRVPEPESGSCSKDPETGEERYAKPNKQGDLCCFVKPKKLNKEAIIRAYQEHGATMPPSVLLLLDLNRQPVMTRSVRKAESKIDIDDTGRTSIDGRLAIRTPVDKLVGVAAAAGVPTTLQDARRTPLSRQQIATLMARKIVAEQGIPENRPATFYQGLHQQLFGTEGPKNFNRQAVRERARRLFSSTNEI